MLVSSCFVCLRMNKNPLTLARTPYAYQTEHLVLCCHLVATTRMWASVAQGHRVALREILATDSPGSTETELSHALEHMASLTAS